MGSDEFKGKTVLVTGASGGIGRGIALGFAAAGAETVVHFHRNADRAEAVVQEIQSAGGSAYTVQADLTHPEEVTHCFETIWQRSGRLDVLVNNAGVYLANALITEMAPEDWQRMIDADLTSVFLCTQAAGQWMSAQHTPAPAGQSGVPNRSSGGVILNIASVEGMFPVKGHSYYNTSKAGLIMFSRSAAQELGSKNIRVNTVSPGLIWKEGLEQEWPDGVRSWLRNAPLGSLGMPEDIAEACLFLASDRAKWISGANLVVDGGYSARVIY